MDIPAMLLPIMEENGIHISNNWEETLDLDSVTFILIILSIEKILGYEIPYEYITIRKFLTFQMFVDNISNIVADTDSGINLQISSMG